MECDSRNKLLDRYKKLSHGRHVPIPRPHSKKTHFTVYPSDKAYSHTSTFQIGSAGIQFRRLDVITLTSQPNIAAVSPAVEAKLVSNLPFSHQAELGLTSTVSPEPHSESILWEWLHPPLIRICIGVIQNVIAIKAKRRAKLMRTTLSVK